MNPEIKRHNEYDKWAGLEIAMVYGRVTNDGKR